MTLLPMKNITWSFREISTTRLVGVAVAILTIIGLAAPSGLAAEVGEPVATHPAYPDSEGQLAWDTLRGYFRMQFTLDPPATAWTVVRRDQTQAAGGEYQSGDYQLKISEKEAGEKSRLIKYELTRVDGQTFRMLENNIECKTSISGVYKIFNPGSMSQQSYKIDLPFRVAGGSRAEMNQPVIWMQQTDGQNTLTLGMLNQITDTGFDGSTYNTRNGGEAPGIANSYARVAFRRVLHDPAPMTVFKDGIYVNANPDLTWFEALERYSAAVDEARDFKAVPMSQWAFNPMWHSWYAHADKIDEEQIRDDARRAGELGATTIELDAGWNMARGVQYSFDSEGDYDFDSGRFPDAKGMIDAMHAAGQRVVMHAAPLVLGKNCKNRTKMEDCLLVMDGKAHGFYLDPRLKKVHDHLLAAWEHMFSYYGIDGVWCDFLEILPSADPPASGMEIVTPDLHVAYTQLMQALYKKSLAINPNAVTILRRSSANMNAKTFCTHVWPMDTPQDYNMNRREIVYLKTFGPGVLTHACCTSWAISESDVNVGRQMASIVLAGVPAFSVKLAESPASHNAIIKAWLAFYEQNKRDLVLGRMTPLLPTPPSAALRIEGDNQAFFGFFEAVPGLIEVTKPVNKITLVNAFNKQTATRLEGIEGEWQAKLYNQIWQTMSEATLQTDAKGGLNINFTGPSECHTIVLKKKS